MRLGIESGFDAILGTVFYDSVLELIRANHMTFFPFIGERYTESIRGTIEELTARGGRTEQAKRALQGSMLQHTGMTGTSRSCWNRYRTS